MNNSKYIVDPNGERRAGCFGNAIRYGVGLPLIALLLWVLFGMVGCKSTQPLTQTRDSVRVEFRHDSIYIWQHDSIFRDRWRAGDTVFVTVEKFKTLYKDKLIEIHDTITATQTEQVAVKYVPNYYKHTSTGFWILLSILIVIVGWKIAKIYFKIQSGGLTSFLK